ncbi:hypothetical protein E9993_08510 [Labilibacter sediminis]|nr:hypothetical protein E9993_08510 [Labilibacter sediminis]
MRYTLILLALLCSFNVFAQIEATTKEGKQVVLYDDGSWEYVKVDIEVVNADVDNQLTAESEIKELYHAVSPRLKKYFGEQKGKIRGRAKCGVENGQANIHFQWEVFRSDAYRYFGYMKAGVQLTLRTKNNDEIKLVLTENINYNVMEKYNYSLFEGSAQVSPEQLNHLLTFPVTEVEVEWKKKPESYQLNNPAYFKETFSKILSQE